MPPGTCYTSVLVLRGRHRPVRQRYESLLAEGRLAICHMTALEYLNNAADPRGYEILWRALHAHRRVEVTGKVMDRALDVHRMLAAESQHLHFPLPDLIIAAAAEASGATVLHYDADFDRIAAVTGQPCEWVAAKGSL